MKAVISNPMAVKAAANVANGGYYLSFFQIRRVGDVAEVSGTNGYVVVIATCQRSSRAGATVKASSSAESRHVR